MSEDLSEDGFRIAVQTGYQSVEQYEAVQRDLKYAEDLRSDAISSATKRAYRTDWETYQAYCEARGLIAFQVDIENVKAFIAHRSQLGRSSSSLYRSLAAIRYVHDRVREKIVKKRNDPGLSFQERQNMKVPGTFPHADPELKDILKGQSNRAQRPVSKKTPTLAEDVMKMVDHVRDRTFLGLRNRALLLVGFAGAFRRSELVVIQREHIKFDSEGMTIVIPRSKGDQSGDSQSVAINSEGGSPYCPVRALKDWLEVAEINSGDVFLRMHQKDRIGTGHITPQVVAKIVKAHVVTADLDPAEYSGHSLRSGLITSAANANRSVYKIMDKSRHKSVTTVMEYIQDAKRYEENAGAGLLVKNKIIDNSDNE